MPPKRNKKTKSKRYSCEICTGIDNTLMIQCDDCEARYHLKCLNIESIHESDEWVCVECMKKGPPNSTLPNNISKSVQQPLKQSDASKPENRMSSEQAISDRHSVKSGDQDIEVRSQKSRLTDQRSQATRSSIKRRTQIELERIEEERQLKEKRDKEYLENKYRVLLEDCSEKSSRHASEKRSTDRSSYTRDWVENQNVTQRPDVSRLPPIIKRTDSRAPLDEKQRFLRRLDQIALSETSQLDRPENSSSLTRPPKSLLVRSSIEQMSTTMDPERRQNQWSLMPPVANPIEEQNSSRRDRTPCPAHDARNSMFQDREALNHVPCSNSTFAVSHKSNELSANPQRKNQSLPRKDTDVTEYSLEWDNFLTTQSYENKMSSRQTQNNRHKEMMYNTTRQTNVNGYYAQKPTVELQLNPNNSKSFSSFNPKFSRNDISVTKPATELQVDPNYTKLYDSFDPKVSKNTYEDENPSYGGFENYTQSSKNQHFDDDVKPNKDDGHFTFDHRSSNSRNERRVEFKDSKQNYSQTQSKLLSVESQPGINYVSASQSGPKYAPASQPGTSHVPASQPNRQIKADQIAARHVVEKKLAIFTGDPSEWPIWYNQYKNSTELCGFTNGENLSRLEKSIQGKARDLVRSRLIFPDSVPWIIATLKMRYGRPEVIIKSIISKIRDYPPIKSEKLEALIDFAFEVQTICTTIESLNSPNHLMDPMLLDELVDKLPTQEKKEWARYKAGNSNATIKTLATWLYDLAEILSSVATPPTMKSSEHKTHVNVHLNEERPEDGNYRESNKREQIQRKMFPCLICSNECTTAENCLKFKSYTIDERWKAIYEHRLCRRCLRKHKFPCRATTTCGKNGCQYKHHFLLHNDEKHPPPSPTNVLSTDTVANAHVHVSYNASTMLRIVPVILYNGSKKIATFAFLDDGSTVTMMEQWLATELGLGGTAEQMCLIWTNKIHRRERVERVTLQISGIEGFDRRYELKGVRTVKDLSLPAQSINKKELVEAYPYLKDVPLVDYENAVPGIMIGSNMPNFGTQLQVIESNEVEYGKFIGPIASKTRLGWSVHGPRNTSESDRHVNVHQFEVCTNHNQTDDEIHQKVKEFFSVENFGVQANCALKIESKDDERATNMLQQLTKRKNGKYETGLLWKTDNINLPDSYPMAVKRLISLEKQGPETVKLLGAKVNDYIAKGYASKLSNKDLQYKGSVWYLPIFGVVHPKKPGKLRMVFDAAAKVKTTSLNSVLLKGPDLYTSLIDILRRFRERLYTGGGDIAEMYHQVSVIEKDRHFQRFLYRADNMKKPDIYQMDVMTFGAVCSPSAAQFVKNKNANEFKGSHPRAVESIISNHYVDDMMDCEHTEEAMIKLMKDVKMIHAHGGFNIRNFISNSDLVLKALGEDEAKENKDISFKSELKMERVLGMWYNTKADTFTFSLKYTQISNELLNGTKMPTKREILRTLMSIFDPLGLLSNYLIHLKILLQEIWRSKMDWDEQLSDENLIRQWKRWLEILPDVENLRVPRLYSTKMSPKEPKSIQMHVFVDASEDAFTATVYFRVEDDDGVDCTLAGSKARVAPLRYLSITRKELQAGVLGTRLSTSIINAQRFKVNRRIIWTDSSTVVSWLNSDHRKYSQFVAHRVGEILESTDVNEWRWIPTKENVADEGTKWAKTPNFQYSNRWFNGPDFLRLSEDQWPEKKPVKIDVEEEMKANFAHSSFVIPKIIDPERFSSYKRMVRSLAYVIRFRNLFTGKSTKGEPLSQDELHRAENSIIRQAQFEGYPAEMVTLERNKVLPVKKTKIHRKTKSTIRWHTIP